MRLSKRAAFGAALLLGLLALTGPFLARPPASPVRLVIVQPGYPGSTESASGYVGRLTRYLEDEAGKSAATGAYFNVPAEALSEIAKRPPTHGIVSPGFYLEHRERLGLVPVLEVLPEGRYYLARTADATGGGAEGGPAEISLAGKRVVGGALYDEKFLGRVALSGVEGTEEWTAVPTLRITRGIRKLERGDYDAVVMTEREYQGLEKLGRLKTLEILRRSEYYPVALFVAFGGRGASAKASRASPSATTRALAKALRSMEKSSEGKEILETLGCEGFRAVRADWLEKLEKRYDGEEKKEE